MKMILAGAAIAAVAVVGAEYAAWRAEDEQGRQAAQKAQAELQAKRDLAIRVEGIELEARVAAEIEMANRRDAKAAKRRDDANRSADMEMAVQRGVETALEADRDKRKH